MSQVKLLSFTNDGSLLAACTAKDVLKIWDTTSGILEHEFHPGKNLASSVTCLQFYPKHKKNYKKKKKRNSQTVDDPSEFLVALGTIEGRILIYSPNKQIVISQFNHSVNSSVVDLYWHSPDALISIGKNKKLTVWNKKFKKLYVLDIIQGQSFCTLGENKFVIGSTNLEFIDFDPSSSETKQTTIPAHRTSITQLVPIFLEDELNARYLLSASENDRFVYAWSTDQSLTEPVGTFMAKDIVIKVCCMDMGKSSVGIAVVTKKGFLRFFLHHLNGSKNTGPAACKGCLQIESKSAKSSLTILSAQFLSKTELIIVYGTTLFPRCERVPIECLEGKVSWVRQDPSVLTQNTTKSSLLRTVTPHVPNEAVHLMPTQMNPPEMKEIRGKRKMGAASSNLPMEERLESLSITQPLGGSPDSRPLDNYVHLLVQALHSKDSTLMNSILIKGEDEEIINNTVRRLPVPCVVPFLNYLQDVVVGKGIKNLTCINWVKSVLYHHMSLLSSVPDKESLFEPFYAIFAARTSSLLAVTKLHSRIGLLLMHVKNRHENTSQGASNSAIEPLLKYMEDSSDEEGLDLRMEAEGGPSESEDIWDDLTESEEEEEDEEPGLNGTIEEEGKRVGKRKLNHEEDFVSLSDSEEQMENDDNDSDVESVSDSE